MVSARRIAALVLPELPCELLGCEGGAPVGVIVAPPGEAGAEREGSAVLGAVNASARRLGVRAGQTLAEARALTACLRVRELPHARILATLGRVAEAARAFGAPVAVELPGVPPQDTVWLDISASVPLLGSEVAIRTELHDLVRQMGHSVRIAVASGPRLAQVLAEWSPAARLRDCADPLDTPAARAALPVLGLPIDREQAGWLGRLGILTVADLAQLPRAAVASRLGDRASDVLDLCEGHDPMPLPDHQPAKVLEEAQSFEEAVEGVEPLRFALRGLAFRMSARLRGRGEAARVLVLGLQHDRRLAELRRAAARTELRFDLAGPLWREEDLIRVVTSRLERTRLAAPTVSLSISVPALVRAVTQQLPLRSAAAARVAWHGEALPVLLAELYADLGADRVGVLELLDSHRPEARSRLRPVGAAPTVRPSRIGCFQREPTRLFVTPLPLHAELRVGAAVVLEHRLFTMTRIAFEQRLEATEWWGGSPGVARDTLRIWLEGAEGGLEAIVFVDRSSGARFLQGLVD
jgi:protein ImuB